MSRMPKAKSVLQISEKKKVIARRANAIGASGSNAEKKFKLKLSGTKLSAANPNSSDVEESDDEQEVAIEEQFILRLPPGELCDRLREQVQKREVSEDVGFVFKGERYSARLVDLPCIIESQKTLDNKQLYKIADICQMLVVEKPITDESQLPTSNDYVWPDGITPALKNVRKRRFRKRISKQTIEVVEKEVERLLQEDARAEKVDHELREAKEHEVSDSEIDTPAVDHGDNEQETEVEGDADEGSDYADLQAEMERTLTGDLKVEDEEDDEDDEDEDEDEDDDEDDDESEDDDEESESENEEMDQESKELTKERKRLVDEIADVESSIQKRRAEREQSKSNNPIIKKRFETTLLTLTTDLEKKKSQLRDVEAKIGGV